MRKISLLLSFLFLSMSVLAQAPSPAVGDWVGALDVGGTKLRLVLHVTGGEAGLRATLDSVDQGVTGIPVDVITFEGKSLHLELSSIGGSYQGTLDDAGNAFAGTWKQGAATLPLRFERTNDASSFIPKRPQEPKPPFPYDVEDVTFANGDVKLAGTLTIPRSAGPHPAVLLITGSGPQDRDEAILGHKPFLVLADHLTRNGIEVLRVDDRGVGKSTGSFATATTEYFATDALAAVTFLKSRSEVDAKRIGLIGHSEGGLTAPLVATRSSDVAFIVLMAGVGVPMEDLLREQTRLILKVSGAPASYIDLNDQTLLKMCVIAKSNSDPKTTEEQLRETGRWMLGEMTDSDKKTMGASESMFDATVTMLNTPWMRFLLSYDPAATLRRVKVPVLALNGSLDLQVPPKQNLPAIKKALADGGNKDATVTELPGLNHLFQTATTGAPYEYATIEETMSPVALKTISDWIAARTLRAQK
jgi:fermentation-respiration switch protein FrsA (DUF1100 family)